MLEPCSLPQPIPRTGFRVFILICLLPSTWKMCFWSWFSQTVSCVMTVALGRRNINSKQWNIAGGWGALGEGSGAPLQYSCLENRMDGGAWWATVHGVTKSQTGLSDFTFSFHFYALEKEMATHCSVLAWKIPWTEEPGGLQSMGSLRVGQDWATSLSVFTFMHWRRKWQPTTVFLPGESHGWQSLVGYCLWDRTESDTTEVT